VAHRDAEAEEAEQQQPHGARHWWWCCASLRCAWVSLIFFLRHVLSLNPVCACGFGWRRGGRWVQIEVGQASKIGGAWKV
jgi:hypothetical protein